MSARALALEVLDRVERDGAWLRPALDGALGRAGLSPKDRAFASELAYGTQRWRLRLDHAIDFHAKRGIDSVDPGLLRVMRLGVYQLLFTRVKPHAAVNETVELARKRAGEPGARFVNAILRALIRAGGPPPLPDPKDLASHLSVRESHPAWFVRWLLEERGADDAEATLKAQNEQAPMVARTNFARITREELVARLAEEGVTATPTEYSPRGLKLEGLRDVAASTAFREGLYIIQGESSQLVCDLVGVAPEDRVLDLCAAPGGKTTALAEAASRGHVDAVDLYPARARMVQEHARRMGLDNIDVRGADSSGPLDFAEAMSYDAVLVDAPCSGLGVLRRHPEAKWRMAPEQPGAMAQLQLRILDNAAGYLRPGGTLVYSVCTFNRTECEDVIGGFAAGHSEFSVVPATGSFATADGFFRIETHRTGLDGFFAARLRKATT